MPNAIFCKKDRARLVPAKGMKARKHRKTEFEEPKQRYPKLYEDPPEKTQSAGSFQQQTATFVDIQDQRVRLRDNALVKLGETVFKVKLL